MTTPALLYCHDSGREAASMGLDELTALEAFRMGYRCARQTPIEIGIRYTELGPMAHYRPSLLRRVFSGVAGLLLQDRRAW